MRIVILVTKFINMTIAISLRSKVVVVFISAGRDGISRGPGDSDIPLTCNG